MTGLQKLIESVSDGLVYLAAEVACWGGVLVGLLLAFSGLIWGGRVGEIFQYVDEGRRLLAVLPGLGVVMVSLVGLAVTRAAKRVANAQAASKELR